MHMIAHDAPGSATIGPSWSTASAAERHRAPAMAMRSGPEMQTSVGSADSIV